MGDVKAPSLDVPEEEWAGFAERAAAIDRSEQFAAIMGARASLNSCIPDGYGRYADQLL